MMRYKSGVIIIAIIIFFGWGNNLYTQASENWTSSEMYLALRKLKVLGSVLYVAAHPDDENTRLISYFSKDRMVRTGYLSLTRGDGGQNLIGNEQGIELGLIRTQELLAARRVDGGEQYFSRAYDFGFSKNPEETFTKWERDKILSDVVWVIRLFRPDVIITRFPTTGEGGHGHHTASAILANEAFNAAADASRFPEQLKYVQTWQAKRIVWNGFNFGGANTNNADLFKLDVGGYNPLLGMSYGEIAAISRSNHKSQGFGSAASRGETFEYFKSTGGSAPVTDIFDGVDLSWSRVAGSKHIENLIDSINREFDLLHPEKSVPSLVRLHKALSTIQDSYWRNQKRKEVENIILQCSGLFMDATTNEQFAVKTDSVRINFSFNNRLGSAATLKNVSVVSSVNFDTTINKVLQRNQNFNFGRTFYVHPSTKETQPYWLELPKAEGYFNVDNQLKIGQPDVDPSFVMVAEIQLEGETLAFNRPVRYKFTDPVKGELYEPLVVLPPLVISTDEPLKISKDNNEMEGTLKVQAKKRNVWVSVNGINMRTEDKAVYAFTPKKFLLSERNAVADVNYQIKGNKDNDYDFWVIADSLKKETLAGEKENNAYNRFNRELHEIKYDHIPYINYFSTATVSNKRLDLKIAGKKIGYIIGAGDKVPEALERMGYEVTLLGDKELSRNNLSQFDAILTGVRAYNTNEWLNKHYSRLMKYVNDGGNLVVQYNTSTNIGPVRAKIGPYNFNISRTRVTDENADVNVLIPSHPVLNFPNKIGPTDFLGWAQERSIYHAGEYDKDKFQAIFSMNDPGEAPNDGSLIISKYGKGYFTYTGLVFFRELPAGVPGAYRLLANILALNSKKAF